MLGFSGLRCFDSLCLNSVFTCS